MKRQTLPHPLPLSPWRLRRLHLLILLALFTLSCRLVDEAFQSGANETPAGVDRNDAIFFDGGQPQTLDPAKTHGGPDGELGHIFSGLVTLDQTMQVQPELAAGWTVSDDGRTYTFYLRQNALFHDGRPLTAGDVIYSWERAANPDTGSDTAQTYLGDIVGVQEMLDGQADHIRGLRAIDDHTLEVQLREPVVYFLQKLAYPVAFVVDRNNVTAANWEHHPNGTGPYKLQTWRDDELIVLERFDNYYLEPAATRHIVINLGPGLSLGRYEQGQIDLVGIGGANLERARDPNNRFYDELATAVALCTATIGLNNRLAPFDDVRVRQAFNLALDRELLIETFSDGNAIPASGALPPGMPGYIYKPERGYPYDPTQARQLLAEAGYSDISQFPTLTYTTSGYGDVSDYDAAIITMWQENLGVTIEPQIIDPFQYYDEIYNGNVGHFFGGGWCADYPDPQNFLDILYHSGSRQNIGGYQNTAVDALLETGRVARDVNQRMALYAEIEDEIVADAPVVFLNHGLSAVLVSPELQNYVLTPFGVRQWHLLAVDRSS
ncbi:MAG: peptide ABC transporter substrate-binding protein [Anaerolineae bacterium]|nr:peptide ABC transporter substrate-binding protein [Anaerolineae bacterium]